MFNMQSGLHRQSFPARAPAGREWRDGAYLDFAIQTTAHNGTVQAVNHQASHSFGAGKFLDELDWHPMAAITGLRYSKASELVAFSCDDPSRNFPERRSQNYIPAKVNL
jgi:U3 small nucleolar RNA-associated protein 21